MDANLAKSLMALVPISMLFIGSVVFFVRAKSPWIFVQLVGAGSLVIVVLAHVCEALQLFPWMGWGFEHSAGHYLDLSSATVGLTMLPLGYLVSSFHAVKK